MRSTAIATLREPSLILEEVQHLLENGSFQLPEFNLQDDISKPTKMLSRKDFLTEGLASPVITAFPTQKEVYQRHLAEVEEAVKYQTSFLDRISVALKAGYSPFTVNKTWFCGLLEPEQVSIVQDKRYPLFNRVLPGVVWEKYQIAKNLGIFDVILVHSPVLDDFNIESVKIIRVDPILIAYIRNGKPSQIKFAKYDTQEKRFMDSNLFSFIGGEEKVIPFLIAQWDLSKDLQAGQI